MRSLRFVDEATYKSFWDEWHQIDLRFPHFSDPPDDVSLAEHWTNMTFLRNAAREELRQAMRSIEVYEGRFTIVV